MDRAPIHCETIKDVARVIESYHQQYPRKPRVEVSESDTRRMRAMRLNGYLLREIAEHFNVSDMTVCNHTRCIPASTRWKRNYVAHRRTGKAPTVSLVSLSVSKPQEKPQERVIFYG